MKNRRITDVEFQTVIGDETEVSGDIKAKKNIRIKGEFNGDIVTKGVIWVDFTGIVNGSVSGKFVIISGKVTGDVNAKKKLELGRNAEVGGIVSAKEVYIEKKSKKGNVEGKKKTEEFDERRESFLDNLEED